MRVCGAGGRHVGFLTYLRTGSSRIVPHTRVQPVTIDTLKCTGSYGRIPNRAKPKETRGHETVFLGGVGVWLGGTERERFSQFGLMPSKTTRAAGSEPNGAARTISRRTTLRNPRATLADYDPDLPQVE